ncbi:hypothetical protein [Nostoc sp.]|uniref:hypothetical protein n=1 Tax=Nostoc sp. TaxID=1180 RepID=UPI002FFBBFE9
MANIIGTNANDTLIGTNSADTINGKAGNDTITGDYGNDTLTGGGGKDTFVYNLDGSIDTIRDFQEIKYTASKNDNHYKGGEVLGCQRQPKTSPNTHEKSALPGLSQECYLIINYS